MSRKAPITATSERLSGPIKNIPIDAINQDPELQVRVKGTDRATTLRYRTIIRANPEAFPPIRLADVGGWLYCVDGWHRLAAHRLAEQRFIKAEVVPMSREAALWEAARANLTNARPLSKADLQQAFRMYVNSRQHRKQDRNYKSYREIAADFENVKSYNTIRTWMFRMFPSVARAMAKGGSEDGMGGDARTRGDDRARVQAVMEAIRVTQEHLEALGPPRNRPEIAAGIATIAHTAGLGDDWKPGPALPF